MKWIIIKLDLEALHKWNDAYEEISFLANLHRHIFNIKVYVQVNHDDRDIEFIDLKHKLLAYLDSVLEKKILGTHVYNLVGSCEMLGEQVQNFIHQNFKGRACKVEVYEDNENGALIE